MFVEPSGRIFVNIFGEQYPNLKDFLVSCCEPVSRTHHVNEFRITAESLSAAEAEGSYPVERVRGILKRYGIPCRPPPVPLEQPLQLENGVCRGEGDDSCCAFVIPADIEAMLAAQERATTLRLVLRRRYGAARAAAAAAAGGDEGASPSDTATATPALPLAYYLCGHSRAFLSWVVESHPAVRVCLEPTTVGGVAQLIISDREEVDVVAVAASANSSGGGGGGGGGDADVVAGGAGAVASFESRVTRTRTVTKTIFCTQVRDGELRALRREVQRNLGVSIDCFYDFHSDTVSRSVPNFTLKSTTRLRPYQEASLERFQRGKKAHHGVVVLPCGAGKTLTGIAASAIVGKRAVIVCCSVLSVLQWREQFLRWTNLRRNQVTIYTKDEKQEPGDIFITTYNMIALRQSSTATTTYKDMSAEAEERRRANAERRVAMLQSLKTSACGLLVLDEVHMAPADSFQKVIENVMHHCVLGLTATLLREDDKIVDLRYLIGPKLYEANWLELTRAGHLATVACAEVRCPLPPAFVERYLSTTKDSAWKDIECINPTKLWCVQALLQFHESRSPPDKTIIFCDCIPAAKYYAHKLGIPFMTGKVSNAERSNLISYFRFSSQLNAVILSRVGDIALDMPEATVIIQVSALFGSRRQEAQRLGRILRPKPPSLDNSCAFFYTLISLDTDEVRHAFSRQSWLRDQGFAYRVLSAQDIMDAFFAVGGEPLCIGPALWSHATESGWDELPAAASGEIEHAFLDGKALVELRGLRARVTFDTADLPRTNGTILFEATGEARRVRRARGSASERHECIPRHDAGAAETPCLRHALDRIGLRSAGGVAGGGTGVGGLSGGGLADVGPPKRRARK